MHNIVTHNATFHADDVFAVAVIALEQGGIENIKVTRTRDEALIAAADTVVDVGGIYDAALRRFDHHQEGGAGLRENKTPYAAFGLVWKHLGPAICESQDIANDIERKIVAPNDTLDNGVDIAEALFEGVYAYDISSYVRAYNPTWREEQSWGTGPEADAKRDALFMELVAWAMNLLKREIVRSGDKIAAKSLVEDAFARAEDKRIIVLDQYYPYQEVLNAHSEPLFVVYPNPQSGSWSAKAVTIEKDSYDNRLDFPKAWAGKRDADLITLSGVADAVFCHSKLFMTVARSKEGALALAQKAIAEAGVVSSIR